MLGCAIAICQHIIPVFNSIAVDEGYTHLKMNEFCIPLYMHDIVGMQGWVSTEKTEILLRIPLNHKSSLFYFQFVEESSQKLKGNSPKTKYSKELVMIGEASYDANDSACHKFTKLYSSQYNKRFSSIILAFSNFRDCWYCCAS